MTTVAVNKLPLTAVKNPKTLRVLGLRQRTDHRDRLITPAKRPTRSMQAAAEKAHRLYQTARLAAFDICQEDPTEVLAARRLPPAPKCTVVTAEELEALGVVFAPCNQDSGDLSTAHFMHHHGFDEANSEADGEEAERFAHYQHLAPLTPINPTRARLKGVRAPSADGSTPGARMPAPATRCRWHTHVRVRLPDSDEPRHWGLPSDQDE